jgi:NADP-dependent 3-hydroxy acid dehydrogenase YdfG
LEVLMNIVCRGNYVITGGAGAIAGHVAQAFADAGARLALVDVAPERLEERARQLGALALPADLTSLEAATEMVRSAIEKLGGIDGLIHTTGGFAMAPAHQAGPGLYDRMLDLNLRTLFTVSRAVLPHFVDRGAGFLAGFSAMPAWQCSGGGGMSLYAAAKAAVTAYLRAIDDELGSQGVRTAVVYPLGVVDTPANRSSMPEADPSKWIDPAEIANALLFAATRGPRGRLTDLPVAPPGTA